MSQNRSYKIYAVLSSGYEDTALLRCFTLKSAAEIFVGVLQREHQDHVNSTHEYVEPRNYRVKQIDLVTHDGAHAINLDLINASKKRVKSPK